MKESERRGARGKMRNTDKGKHGENGGLLMLNISEEEGTTGSYENKKRLQGGGRNCWGDGERRKIKV